MKKTIVILITLCNFIIKVSFSQGTCSTALPFCTGTNYTFPASTNTPPPSNAYFDCLFTQPNPAFYFMEIDNPGNMTINIQGGNPPWNTNDIDFICWGPFTNPATMCNQLTAANVVDCSYSSTWNEFCQINGASSGDYYVLLITNYSNQTCNITFSQTSGNATTNCCILGGDAGDDNTVNICDTDPSFNMMNQLLGNPDLGGTWYDNSNSVVSNTFNPSIHQSGIYSYIVPGSSSACPDDTSFLTINVNTSPLVTLSNFSDMCDNDSMIILNTGVPSGGNYFINNSIVTNFTPSTSNIGSNIITYNYTDINGCSGIASQNITVHASPYANAITTNVSCNGFNNGSATLNISLGTSPYNENWFGANPQLLTAGIYGYTVTDINGCSFNDSIIIYEPPAININVITTDVSCNGQNDGTAIVEINGISMPTGTVSTLSYCASTPGSNFSSTIDNVQINGDIFNINNNTSGICDQYEDYTNLYADITEGQNYIIDITLGDCSGNNYPSGGKVYIDWNIDGDFLDPGEEIGTIPAGVSSSISLPILVPYSGVHGPTRMRIVSQFLNNSPVSSIGPCDVGIMANPIYVQPWFGATEDYSIVINPGAINATYLWSSGQNTDSVSNLSSGMYSVDVIDQNGCVSTSSFSISEPSEIIVSTSQNNISCYGGSDGSFSLNISGGIADYTISAAGTTQTLTGGLTTYSTSNSLTSGNYVYTVTDSNNCIYTNNILLTSPNPISLTESITNVSCFGGNDGNVVLTTSGGIPPYTYDWGINNSSSLSVGVYNYTVTDNNGCVFLDSVSITEPSAININSIYNNVSTCGANDGNIDVSILGGTQPYTYVWNNGSITQDINNLTAGTYMLTVTDINLCEDSISITITEPSSPTISYTQTNTSCNGGNDGSIDITVINGIGPYQYFWSNSSTSEDINNLTAGTYTVNVTDGNNCLVSENISITQPPIITLVSTTTNVTNCNGTNGSIDITASGGVGNYTYLWNNSDTTEDIHNLSSGIYSVNISDGNNCTNFFTFTINEPAGIFVNESITHVSCFNQNDGSVILSVNGGQAPYIENWNGQNPLSLSAGTYTYIITDNLNCSFSNNVTINEPQELIISPTINHVLCNGGNSGYIDLNISGGIAPYNEDWGIANPNSLFAGTFNFIVTDNNGCQLSDQISINEPDSLTSNISIIDASCFGYNDGSATINTNGGISPYTQNWFGENNSALYAGNYSVLVTDSNGCNNIINFMVSEPNQIVFVIDSFPTSCFGYNDGSAILTISGGSPPFSENWYGQDPFNLSAGTHTFSISDNNNCIQQGVATIYEPNQIYTNEIISDVKCFGENNGTAFLEIYGGVPPYLEDWAGVDIFQLSNGVYSYTITDANGCVYNDYVNINEPDIIIVEEDINDANCFNSNDGQVILTISGGTSPYIQDWGLYNPLSLTAGIYHYTVSDINSCSYSDSVIINQTDQITMSFNSESPICIYDSSIISINIDNPLSLHYTLELNDGNNTSYILIDSLGNNFTSGNSLFVSPTETSIISIVSITDENGCNSPVNQEDLIIVNPLPILTLDMPNFCKGDSSIYLNQGLPIGGEYYINNISTNFLDIEHLPIDIYKIRYEYTENNTGCFNQIEQEIQINESPKADFEFGPNLVNIDNPIVEFKNTSSNYSYSIWNINDETNISNEDQFFHIFQEIGEYTITLYVENILGCSDSINYNININPIFTVHIPSAFSPNNDGINDRFGPVLRESGYQSYSIQIFNKWGEKIFDEFNMPWNGKMNNKLCQNGIYTYSIILYDFLGKPHSRTGILNLIR